MKYTESTFTLPTCTRRMTDEEYLIAVGRLCPVCKQKLTQKHVCPESE